MHCTFISMGHIGSFTLGARGLHENEVSFVLSARFASLRPAVWMAMGSV